MTHILTNGTMAVIFAAGVIACLGIAGAAVIYCLGANEEPKGRRITFGIIGLAMLAVLAYTVIYITRNGWPL